MFGWDTDEMVNGYSVNELENLKNIIDKTIHRMNISLPNQLTLFEE